MVYCVPTWKGTTASCALHILKCFCTSSTSVLFCFMTSKENVHWYFNKGEIVSQTLQKKRQIPIKATEVIRGGSREPAESFWATFETLMYFQEEAPSIHSLPLSESSGLAVLEPGRRSNELRNHLELTAVCTLNLRAHLWRGIEFVFSCDVLLQLRSQPTG